ncbi:TetR/AcrR family transcriptional regulator [Streptomyces hawaiiensis]|uniref:TetR/AcrR family transcriptional regulator n=1 Tax=Streptomyces hawaiiensis TaxID=67305 RepID=UPI0036625212
MTPEAPVNPQVARSRAAAMDAGREILASDGWDAVTYVAVAERSGVGRTTLYRHWPKIEEFLRDVLLRDLEMTHPTPTGATREDLIAELDSLRIQLHVPSVERSILTIIQRASHNADFARLGSDLYQSCSRAIGQIIRAARKGGDIDSTLDVPRAVAELAGPLVYQRLLGRKTFTRKFTETVVDDFLRAHRPSAR